MPIRRTRRSVKIGPLQVNLGKDGKVTSTSIKSGKVTHNFTSGQSSVPLAPGYSYVSAGKKAKEKTRRGKQSKPAPTDMHGALLQKGDRVRYRGIQEDSRYFDQFGTITQAKSWEHTSADFDRGGTVTDNSFMFERGEQVPIEHS